jgi:hypothetical protein
LLDAICIDSSYVIDGVTVANADTSSELQQKKIISLNKGALVTEDDDKSDDDDDNDDDSSTSSEGNEGNGGNGHNESKGDDFELKIGYKSSSDTAKHLNYGNMSVSALRQLAKERGLGDGDLQKLKKKELVQLLNNE